ncbi:hypothetical protein Scep_015588 [Stephania cephalantha]|uniref:Protein phosphatase n=1 Tax=Stephania cephalantha TaxID=152367 RepID=A0AAP0P0I7_9MAGN
MANQSLRCSLSIPHLSPNSASSHPKRRASLSCTQSEHLSSVRTEFSFSVGTYLIPHPKKVERGGEDAFLVSSYNGGVLAIADGVSGWAEQDVDPALFSRELMANASSLVDDEEVNYDPRILLKKAHSATCSVGSATVVVAMLEKSGVLKIANVGDCGLRILRGGKIFFSTSPQEHYFDCPYQLSSESLGQTYLDAAVNKMELAEGDVIVMGSDGLFDNVFDHEIVSVTSRFEDAAEAVIAKALANLASDHSRDANFDSPYSLEARGQGFLIRFIYKIIKMRCTLHVIPYITGMYIVAQVRSWVLFLQAMASSASTTSSRYLGASLEKASSAWYTPHMAAASRAILHRIPLVDFVVEVRDARVLLYGL